MKKIIYSIVFSAAVILLALVSGCVDNLQPQIEPVENGTLSLTLTANKADATTKALAIEGNTIDATWANGESVDVYKGENKVGELIATDGFGTTTTTLSGTVDNTVKADDNLTLKFKSPNYNNQDGTLESIAANCDYATATVEVQSVDNNVVIPKTSSVSFTNQQAIVKFSLKYYYSQYSYESITPKRMIIKFGSNRVVFTLSNSFSPGDSFYAAIPGDSNKDITINAEYYSGDQPTYVYYYKKTGVTLANGSYYRLTVKMDKADLYTPLTFEAAEEGETRVRFTQGVDIDFGNKVEYNKNDGDWTTYASGTDIILAKGDIVSFRGGLDAYRYNTAEARPGSNFSCTKDCYLYGNLMSLVDSTGFANNTVLTGQCAFSQLFKGNTHIKNYPGSSYFKPITMPATTLTQECYYEMFSGCTGLTMMPTLKAKNMESRCYQGMFKECTSLTVTSMYSASTLAESCFEEMFKGCSKLDQSPNLAGSNVPLATRCYFGMFEDCTSLIGLPSNYLPRVSLKDANNEDAQYCYGKMYKGCTHLYNLESNMLPATTLSKACYYQMFMGCTSLTQKLNLPAGKTEGALAESCYKSMFQGCTNLSNVPDLPATSLAQSCYESMFEGCVYLYNAPALPAETLAQSCYERMFHGCTFLAASPVLSAPTLVSYCYSEMFEDCTNLSSITCLATYLDATSCTTNWVHNVKSNGTFIKSPNISEDTWKSGSFWSVSRIPATWTVTNYVTP